MAYKYLILDSRGKPVGRCMSKDSLSERVWRLELEDEDLEKVMTHTNISLVGTGENWAAAEGRIVRQKENMIWVEAVRELNEALRENLRVPVRFQSFLYPVSGGWRGRRTVLSYDLSCGGVAFYCMQPLIIGELAQIVVPVTTEPLVLPMKILRQIPSEEPIPLYAAKFMNLTREEESMVREAVFNLQLQGV